MTIKNYLTCVFAVLFEIWYVSRFAMLGIRNYAIRGFNVYRRFNILLKWKYETHANILSFFSSWCVCVYVCLYANIEYYSMNNQNQNQNKHHFTFFSSVFVIQFNLCCTEDGWYEKLQFENTCVRQSFVFLLSIQNCAEWISLHCIGSIMSLIFHLTVITSVPLLTNNWDSYYAWTIANKRTFCNSNQIAYLIIDTIRKWSIFFSEKKKESILIIILFFLCTWRKKMWHSPKERK